MSLQLNVNYEPLPGTELSGFEMGDITVIGEQLTVVIGGSMVFLSIADMMSKVEGLFSSRKGWTCFWTAADTSQGLEFKKPGHDSVEIYAQGRLVGGDSLQVFAQTLLNCVTPILREIQTLTEQDDAGFYDLNYVRITDMGYL